MTTIDQRILIPAPPPVVWDYVSNIENNPHWQVDCESLVFLSQRRNGVGARWRQRTPGRTETVYEVTTWYAGLGYEYVYIDGGGLQDSSGRVRLQEIPEGTIVQWTYNYELGGVFGGIRNALTTQRRIEADMIESLKMLWKISRRMGSMEGYQARSLMQDGPQSPQERLGYQPRHSDSLMDQPSGVHRDSAGNLYIPEPPISDEDTRPGAAAKSDRIDQSDPRFAPTTEDAPAPVEAQPTSDAQPPSAESPAEQTTDEAFAPPPERISQEMPAISVDTTPEPHVPVEVQPADPAPVAHVSAPSDKPEDTAEAAPTTTESHAATQESPTAATTEPSSEADVAAPTVSKATDTSEISIWEVFGIPSPTDTQKMRAIKVAEEAEREYEEEQQEHTNGAVPVSYTGNRQGLRMHARRQSVRVRRPGK